MVVLLHEAQRWLSTPRTLWTAGLHGSEVDLLEAQGTLAPYLSWSSASGIWCWLNIGGNIKLDRRVTVVVLADWRSGNLSQEDFLGWASQLEGPVEQLSETFIERSSGIHGWSSPDVLGWGGTRVMRVAIWWVEFPETGALNYEVANKFTS